MGIGFCRERGAYPPAPFLLSERKGGCFLVVWSACPGAPKYRMGHRSTLRCFAEFTLSAV
jgi:hypothetical protein